VLYLKACPRCKGDLAENVDMYGPYRECLQCGYMVDLEDATTAKKVEEKLISTEGYRHGRTARKNKVKNPA